MHGSITAEDDQYVGVEVVDSNDGTPTGLADDQIELVEKHKELVNKFESECQHILDELSEEDLPDETYFRDALKDYGKHQGLAQIPFVAVSQSTEYETVAQMVEKEVAEVGPQAATHIEGAIVTGLIALITASIKAHQKGHFGRDNSGSGDSQGVGSSRRDQ